MDNEQAYREIIEEIIKSKIILFGNFAVYVAKATPGLELDNYGKVIALSGDPKETIHYLLLRFEDKVGRASTLALRAQLKDRYPGLGLPDELM